MVKPQDLQEKDLEVAEQKPTSVEALKVLIGVIQAKILQLKNDPNAQVDLTEEYSALESLKG